MYQQASPPPGTWGSKSLEGGWMQRMEMDWWAAAISCGSPVAWLVGGMKEVGEMCFGRSCEALLGLGVRANEVCGDSKGRLALLGWVLGEAGAVWEIQGVHGNLTCGLWPFSLWQAGSTQAKL